MYLEVYEFNQPRNNFKLDMELEANMLKEEVQEFFDAKTLAERVDAYIDVKFVWQGTQMKSIAAMYIIDEDIVKWVDNFFSIAWMIIKEEIFRIDSSKLGVVQEALNLSEVIVCNANAVKGKKLDEAGKVHKDEAYMERIDATKQIALMLEDLLKPKSY